MTMNEQDDDTKHEYNQYANEVLQLEWEQAERLKQWVADSLWEALMDYDQLHPHEQVNNSQVNHVGGEHTPANALLTTASGRMPDEVADVNPDDGYDSYDADADWDEWLDDAYSAEELERAQQEQEEKRHDH